MKFNSFYDLVLESFSVCDYYGNPLKVKDKVTFMETDYGTHGSTFSNPAEGRIIDIMNGNLIVRNLEDKTLWEVPPMSSVLDDGEGAIDDVEDSDDLELSKPVNADHPYFKRKAMIKQGLTKDQATTAIKI